MDGRTNKENGGRSMDWNAILGAVNGALEKQQKNLNRSLREKARSFSDSELLRYADKPDLNPAARDAVEAEMRRRGL